MYARLQKLMQTI